MGAAARDLARWWPGIAKHFDPPAPTVADVNVYVGDKAVVALLIGTERYPYVVRTATPGGPVDRGPVA